MMIAASDGDISSGRRPPTLSTSLSSASRSPKDKSFAAASCESEDGEWPHVKSSLKLGPFRSPTDCILWTTLLLLGSTCLYVLVIDTASTALFRGSWKGGQILSITSESATITSLVVEEETSQSDSTSSIRIVLVGIVLRRLHAVNELFCDSINSVT